MSLWELLNRSSGPLVLAAIAIFLAILGNQL